MELVLPLTRFRIQVKAISSINFHHYSGSAWRGVFGRALRKVSCVTHERECKACMLYRSCVYSYIFETPPPSDTRYMRRATAAPHPFVLTPDVKLRRLELGEQTNLELVLAGRAKAYLPYVIHALEKAGERGIGPTEGRFEVVGIDQEVPLGSGQWRPIFQDHQLHVVDDAPMAPPAVPDNVVMDISSPVRLRHQGRMVSTSFFPFSALVANLLRRYSMMSYFHGQQEFTVDFKGLIEQAAEVEALETDLHWFSWKRYSSRQHKKISMGGVVGKLCYGGDDIQPFWPLLWVGQYLHIGKGATMGMGQYRITAAEVEQSVIQAA